MQKIYIISNVEYPIQNRLMVEQDDLLVFLNTAKSIRYYNEHKNKIVFHRSPEESYGEVVEGCDNFYVFGQNREIPDTFIKQLKATYDWFYQIEEGKVKCATTGYMVAKYLQYKYPDSEIILVNFGFEVSKSSYRCPYHNWKFEAKELSEFKHIYTAKIADRSDKMKIYYKTAGWLRR